MHRRLTPKNHLLRVSYPVLRLDLNELAALDDGFTVFSLNRTNLTSLRESDYGGRPCETLNDFANRMCIELGLSHPPARIELITYPRVCGFAFNPISVFLCRDEADRLQAVIFEVNSTFGERCHYSFRIADPAARIHKFNATKTMRVSPFNRTKGTYRFRLRDVEGQMTLSIQYFVDGTLLLNTSLDAVFKPLSNRTLATHFGLLPATMFGTLAAIHWNALLLWLRGLPFIGAAAARS